MVANSLTSFFNMTASLTNRLFNWRRSDEDEGWAEKAIDSLVKRLRKKKGQVEKLQEIINHPNSLSECITIPRSTDGRVQVSKKKCLPHVIYCRVWRWPDLQTHHELQPVSNCLHPFSLSNPQAEVCVNPYHYVRVGVSVLPPVLVPRFNEFAPSRLQTAATIVDVNNNNNSQSSYQIGMQARTPSSLANPPFNVTCPLDGFQQSGSSNNEYSCTGSNVAGYVKQHMHATTTTTMEGYTAVMYHQPDSWCTMTYFEQTSRVGPIMYVNSPTVYIDGYTKPLDLRPSKGLETRFSLGTLGTTDCDLTSYLSNNNNIEHVRRSIGPGIALTCSNGNVYLEVLSDHPVFIRSKVLNAEQNFLPSTVCKVLPGGGLRIFSSEVFHQILSDSVQYGFDAVFDLIGSCRIALSFIKGWGANYNRYEVTSTPCWLEIHLNGPLKWLDNVLSSMRGNSVPISSRTD